jgi:excinuclease ABC subunit C
MKILKEGKNSVLKELKREMKWASKNQDFEEAAKIRDQINALEKVLAHSKIFKINYVDVRRQHNWKKSKKILKKILKTEGEISRIEAYDISNIQGQEATGSMVTFINGLPDKNFYRRFKIKISGKPDDIAMLKEVLSRRFKHPEWGLPDLILIDGGIGQLSAALKIKNQKSKIKNIKVMALAKKENELYIEGKKNPVLLKNLPREIFNLILQLRDEAHRFAISYHKKLREIDLFPKK